MNKFVFIAVILMGIPLMCFSENAGSVKSGKVSNEVNKIIARVNDDIITLRDLREFSKSARISGSDKASERGILENLIENKLIVQMAKKEKLKADEEWVKKKMDKLVSTYGGYDKLEESLAEAGLSTKIIRDKIRDSFLIHEAVDKYVNSRISVSPVEITRYYRKHIKEFSFPPKYVCWITKSGKMDFLEKLSEAIKKKGFDKVLADRSGIFFKIESGESGLNSGVKEVVKSIKEGEWRIKEIGGVYYLIYLAKIVPGHKAFLSTVKDEIYRKIWEDKFSKEFKSWIERLKGKAFIKIYSPAS